MHKFPLFLILIFISQFLSAQKLAGTWYGNLNVGGKLPIVIHLDQVKKKKFNASMDSPKQKAFGMKANSTLVKKDSVIISLKMQSIELKLALENDELKGDFLQMGMKIPVTFSRDSSVISLEKPKRPQTPVAPFPYDSKNVKIENPEAKITLAGTITIPKHPKAIVVLVSGSGPQNRNEEILGHEPFWVIADYLSRNNIAVIRYDDRGTAESTGNFSTANTYDFHQDAKAVLKFAQNEFPSLPIGIIGHSEGGMIAEIAAADTTFPLDFAILLAAPGVPIQELMNQQNKDIMKAYGISDTEIENVLKINQKVYRLIIENPAIDQTEVLKFLQNIAPDFKEKSLNYMQLASQISSNWYKTFIAFEPSKYLENIKIPVFALNGNKDLQVEGKSNLSAIDAALEKAGNPNYKTFLYPDLNHLFQPAETGSVDEYERIETTFSEGVLEDLIEWINSILK